jgi:hypothetical protein
MRSILFALPVAGLSLIPSLSYAQTNSGGGASSETMIWRNLQSDAGGRYSILWVSRRVKLLGETPNVRHVVSVEATDSVNPDRGVIFRGTLVIACGSRVAYWASTEVMNFEYIEQSLLQSGNPTEFTPSTAIGPIAFEKACVDESTKVRVFEKALQEAVK